MSTTTSKIDNISLLNRQNLALLSIVSVAVFIGLPIWWKTTEVYRCHLPFEQIEELKHERVPPIVTCLIDVVYLVNDSVDRLSSVVAPVNYNVPTSNGFKLNITSKIKQIYPDFSKTQELLHYIKSNPNHVNLSTPTLTGYYTVYIVPEEPEAITDDVYYSNLRHVIVKYSTTLDDTFKTSISNVMTTLCGGIDETLTQINKKDTVSERAAVSSGYNINLLLVNSGSNIVSWNIQETTNNLLLPFLQDETVSRLANYTISSQILYYTDIELKTKYNNNNNKYFTVSSSQLPTMISNVEAYLGSGVSQWPELNFVIFLPNKVPLYIEEKKDTGKDSFLVPQWGGVVFYNEPINGSGIRRVAMETVMPTIIQQLKLLLGLKERRTSCQSAQYCLYKWDSDSLLILQTVERLSLAKQSLVSLIQLLDNVKNMVINDHIQYEVTESLYQINKCIEDIVNIQWDSAHKAAELALHHAEVAFFDPSILALLYFPDDQKYAIYIPLFLPVGLPVIMALINLIKLHKQKLKKEKLS